MPVQTKEQHFKDLKETMAESISALETKMMNKHKELMNKIETVEKKNRQALQLAKKNKAEINKINNNKVQIKNELASELNLTQKKMRFIS